MTFLKRSNQMRQQFKMNSNSKLIKYFVVLLVLTLFTSVNSHESNYYYYYNSDGDAIQVKNSETDEKNNINTLLPKDFFSVFSNEIPILNSVENQSLNENRDDSNEYFSFKQTPNLIPIVKFLPGQLNYGEQFIGVPKVQTVVITNIGNDYLRLDSISGSTVHFYCSFFTDKLIPPNGNTTFEVYFLARELGPTESILFINTNKGIIKYTVNGIGIANPYKLKPILNARIPINTSFTTQIKLHNPLNVSIQVVEMYTSDDDLHIELLNIRSNKYKIEHKENSDQSFKLINKDLWLLKPFETRQIGLIHFMGRQANNHTAFICIQTKTLNDDQLNETPVYFVLPFELEVTKQFGLFSPLTQVDFGDISLDTNSVIQSKDEMSYFNSNSSISPVYYENDYDMKFERKRSVSLYLTSSASTPLKITDVFSVRHNPALNITYLNNIVIPPDTSHLTKVAEITFDSLKSKKSSQNYGKIVVKTNNTNFSFQIDFNADLHRGSIEYETNKFNYFVLHNNSQANNIDPEQQVHSIELLNSFSFPIAIHSFNLNEYASKYFEISDFKGPIILKSNLKQKVFEIKFKLASYLSDREHNYTEQLVAINHFYSYSLCSINTNFSNIQIPIHIYDAKLSIQTLSNENEILNDLNLDSISINTNKEFKIQIDNFNPIDISLNSFEIKRLLKDEIHNLKTRLDLQFLYYENLNNNDVNSNGVRVRLNKTYTNDNIKNNLKIPAHHRMVVALVIASTGSETDFISSDLFRYELHLSTKYQSSSLVYEFKIVNGELELVSNSGQKLTNINISNFPTQISKHSIQLKSLFNQNLEIHSIEFLNYGNLFSFKWHSNEFQSKTTANIKYGLIKHKKTTQIGNIYFDSKTLCEPSCYAGFYKTGLQDDHLYEQWIKSFTLKPTNKQDAFDIDSKLFKIINKRWSEINRGRILFKSSVRLQLKVAHSDEQFSYSFPIKFNFERPYLTQINQIEFPLSQVHTTVSYHNLTVHNPSNSNLLMQLMFLNNYPQKDQLLQLIKNEPYLFNKVDQFNKRNQEIDSSMFSVHVPLSYSQFNQDHQRTVNQIEQEYQINLSKSSFVILVPANESRTIQIKFKPNKIGHFEDMILMRNNLTVLDVFTLKGESGTAELSVNNMAPMRNSLFFDGIQSDVLTDMSSTSDLSNLIIEMNNNDFINCDPKTSELTEAELRLDALNYKSYLEKLRDTDDSFSKQYKTSFRSKEGILLRNFMLLKNIGTTDLNVFSVLFDGEPCYSRGIELTDCNSFTIQPHPNNTFLLEIRYRPDFTMSLIRKSLTITTNIGDLEYLIEIKISQNMLAQCHDSLPRPVFEEYLYYIGTFLVVLFIFIMLLTSMLESRSIVKYQYKMYRNLCTTEENNNKRVSLQQEQEKQFQTAAQIIITNKQRNKSLLTEIVPKAISPPASPKAAKQTEHLNHRTLAKSLSSPRSVNNSADNTTGLNSAPNANVKKVVNVTKKIKEKDTESDSSVKIVKPSLSKQVSNPVMSDDAKSLAKTVSFTKSSPPIKLKSTKLAESEEAQKQKPVKHAAQNEILSAQRRNYLNQQKVPKKIPVIIETAQKVPIINVKPIDTEFNDDKLTNNKKLINTKINKPFVPMNKNSLEKQDLDYLNSQFRKLQQQNHQQIKEIKYINDSVAMINKSSDSKSYSIKSLSSTSSNSSNLSPNSLLVPQKKSQNDLVNCFLSSNRLEPPPKSGEFSRSMSILSKRSTSSLSGLMTPGDSISRSDSPDFSAADKFGFFDQTDFLSRSINQHDDTNLRTAFRKSDFTDKSSDNDIYDLEKGYYIINDSGSLYNDDKSVNSRNSPLSLSSASDLWIIPNNDLDLMNNQNTLDANYEDLVQGTADFSKNIYELQQNKPIKSMSSSKASIKRPLNSISPIELNKESPSLAKCSKKNMNLKQTVSVDTYDFSKTFNKTNITQSNSMPFTTNKYYGPIQRPNSYQNNNSNNINNNITNNLFLTFPNGSFSAESDLTTKFAASNQQTTQLDQLLQLTGDDFKMLSLLATMPDEASLLNLLKLNAAINKQKQIVPNSETNQFETFSLFGADLPNDAEHVQESFWSSPIELSKPIVSSSATTQPWNSVLLNDFDEPSSLASSHSGNHIRSLWSTGKENSNENSTSEHLQD